MPAICPVFSQIATAKTEDQALLIRLGCKQWRCPICYKRNRELWRHHLMKKISEIGGEWSFHTITMPSQFHKKNNHELNCKNSLERIRKAWDKFMKFLKRNFGKFQYVRVFETHEDGCLHIHFLASFWIQKQDYKFVKKTSKQAAYHYSRIIKDNIVSYGFGNICACENIPTGEFAKTVGYVTKYMTKEDDFVGKYLSNMRIRRIQTSQGIGAVPKSKSEYEWSRKQTISVYENRENQHFDLNRSKLLTDEDFENESHYPSFEEIHRAQKLRLLDKVGK